MTKHRTPLHRPLPFYKRNPFVYWLLLSALALLAGVGLHQWLTSQSKNQVQAASLDLRASQNVDEVWAPIPERERLTQPVNVTPGRQFRALRLNQLALEEILRKAPMENGAALQLSQSILSLPLPDGSLQRFYIEESPTMEPALAAKFPEIKSYRGQGVDDPTVVTRFDWSPRGLHALVLTNQDSFSITPLQLNDLTSYVSYSGQNALSPGDYECLTQQLPETQESTAQADKPRAFSFGTERRNFRIAIATTVEYTNNANLGGGTAAKALASVNSWLNAVNLIYERDLAMHFNLVANNDKVIFSSTDSFTDGNASVMLDEVRGVLSQTLGVSAYDIGHVLGTGNSGVAYVGVGCYDSGSPGPYKGGGVSLISPSATIGNTFYITRIAHELGHQFGAYHSFNDSDPNYSCASNRTATTAWESGSGLTVMSYAGSCNPIAVTRGMHFHGGSIGQIDSYVAYNGTCVSSSGMSNNPPSVTPGNDYTIPRNTPFALTATASDPDSGDTANLSYSWEEKDAGGANYGNPPFTDASDAAGSTRPIFRPYAPVSSPTRYFPSLTYILNNANVPPATTVDSGYVVNTGESLPNVTRVMNFKLTVRDQRGGVSDDDVLISVESGAGPFAVTSPNTNVSWTGGSQQTVTWSVNNTNASPVNCTQVRLLLSTDGGNTFPITLLSATPNDGSETITVPSGYTSSTARLKVEAVNNIFFDISNTNFSLAAGSTACPTISGLNPTSGQTGTTVTLTGNNFTGVSAVKFANNVSASFAVASNTQLTATVPAGAVSGPITVSKSGCSDVQSASFSIVSCSYTLNTTTFNAAATAVTNSVNVTAGTGCAWTATSNASWLTITSGASGSGNGSVNWLIAANTGPARSGTLTIAGQTVTVNQAAGCSYSLSATSQNVAATASNGSVNVTAGTGCSWTAASNANWLTVTAGASGNGNGTVSYSAAANTGAARSGTLTIAGLTLTVNQASGCSFSISATSQSVAATAGTGTVNVTAGTGCSWTAVSNTNWLTISAGASGSGNGAVSFAFSANTGAARSGTLTIAGKTFTVNQAAGCSFSLNATSQSAAAAAGTSTVNVTAGTGCTWTAASNANWLTINTGASGSGNGSVTFAIAANTGAARSGTLTIAGQTFTVNQAGGCTSSLNATSYSATAAAGSSSVNVTAGTGCTWTAASNANWLTVTAGASGSGNGTVSFSIAANTGAARSGTLTIAGVTFTVNQAAGCTFSLSATSQSVAATASTGSVNVTAGTGCAWTATSNANWLTITAGASGSGNGTVNFSAAANTGAARSGTLTIAGQTFTVNQAGGCTSSLSATSYSATAAAGSSSVNVTAGTGCTWTAVSNASWLTVTGGANGSGNGTVNFSITANTGAARSGTLTVAGQTFTVNQAAGCTFALAATSFNAAAAAGSSSVNVTAGTGCTWTAASNANWLTVTNGANGSGNGTVSFSYSANTGAARSGTFTIAGQTFTVNQAAGCSFSLSATSQNVAGTGGPGTLTVTTGTGCTWTAVSNATWLTITSGASGNGTGTVGFTAAANTGAARSGTLTVAGQTVTINQAANCSYSLASTSVSFSATASAGVVNVQSGAGCAWSATSNASWLTITAGSTGSGAGSVNFNVATNTGPARSGTLTVAGQTFTVNQAAGCSYALSSTSKDFTTAGGSATVNVTSASGCAWTAVSNANWLTVTGGASGNGNGTVSFTALANSGPSRTGTLTIAGQTFTVSQSSGCAVQLSATTVSVGAAASTGSLNVTGAAGCAWTATSNANWLTITAGASGSGNGTVSYGVAANTGAARTGLLSIGGITVTVNQAAATCSYSVSPTAQTYDAQGGSKTFNVTTASHCAWTAASNAPWLTLSGSLSFTGSATVTVSAPAYSGPQRSGTLTLAGQTVTVTQTSGCRFVINKNGDVVAAAGANLSATVTSEAGCAWTAASNVNWVTITSGGSGSGSGTVQYSIAPNTSTQSRSGQLTIGGQPILIQQTGIDTTPIAISDLNPTYVQAGSNQFTLTVNGVNFATGSVVRWNGSSRTTTFVSATQLKATITAADVASAGKSSVTVFDGARNLTSNAVDFVIAGAAANLSAASYDTSAFAPEQIVALFGQKLALFTATATSLPLPTTLGGTRVIIKDSAGTERLAPLFFVWASQINYQIPAGMAAGPAQVTVMTDDGNMSMGNIQINPIAPGLFSANSNGAGWAAGLALRLVNGNQQRYEALTTYDPVTKKYVAVPIELGPVPGQLYLVLYGTGLRQRSSLTNVSCTIGGVPATISYAGKQGGMIGVDQLNILLPNGLAGRGAVDILLTVDGKQANVVRIQVQ